jgi:hypothetical protein
MIALHHWNQFTKIAPQKLAKQQNKPKTKKQENNFFGAPKTHLQQFSHKGELWFFAFIHKKHLTLFLGHSVNPYTKFLA